jgi:hypothetical protein
LEKHDGSVGSIGRRQRRTRTCLTPVAGIEHRRVVAKFGVLRENRRQESASHGSALFGFGGDLEPIGELGAIARPVVPRDLSAVEVPASCVRPTPRDNAGMDNFRHIALSAKLTSRRGRAIMRAFRHTKRLASCSSHNSWRILRVCLAIAAPFILVGVFMLGAPFGWPAMLVAIVLLVALCVWRERRLPESRVPAHPNIDFRYAAFNAVAMIVLLAVLLATSTLHFE